MHMIAAAGLNPDDSDIKFDPDDERRYKKQAKKWSRSRGKRRRRWEHELTGRQVKAPPVIIGTANGMLYPIK